MLETRLELITCELMSVGLSASRRQQKRWRHCSRSSYLVLLFSRLENACFVGDCLRLRFEAL